MSDLFNWTEAIDRADHQRAEAKNTFEPPFGDRETWIADRAETLARVPTITPAAARLLAEIDYEETKGEQP